MADKLMYIPNDDKTNYTFCRIKLVVETFGPTNQNSTKDPKVVKPTNKKTVIIRHWGQVQLTA